MIARYQTLAQRIRLEITEINQVIFNTQHHWQKAQTAIEDQDAFLNSVAFNLQSFYTGLEHLFELIAEELDGGTLGGSAWHRELLDQMALEIEGVRPSVLQKTTVEQLDEYRKFRHVMRHVYAQRLNPERMVHLAVGLDGLWQQLQQELVFFSKFLESLSHADE